jgi:hypothetical protein
MMTGDPTIRYRRPGDEEGIVELFAAAFGEERHVEMWRWRYLRSPGGPATVFVAEENGDIVGHVGDVPVPGYALGKRVLIRVAGDLMVRADRRNRGISGRMQQELAGLFRSEPVVLRFPSDHIARMVAAKGGTPAFVERMPSWVSPPTRGRGGLRLPGRMLPTRVAGTLAMALHNMVTRRPPSGVSIDELDLDDDVDDLVTDLAGIAPFLIARDRRYLRWRWLDQPAGTWTMRGARDRTGRLVGFIVLGLDPRVAPGSTPVGRVVDILARDLPTTRALLLHARTELSALGCRAIAFNYCDPRPWAKRACLLSGFLPQRTGPMVLVRLGHPGVAERVGSITDCYMTHGDTDLI